MSPDRDNISSPRDSTSTIEQKAADWLILCDQGLNPKQQREFEQWLQSDERHAREYAELSKTWNLIGQVRQLKPSPPVSPAPADTTISRAKWQKPVLWLAVAASVALAVFFARPRAVMTPDFTLTISTEIGVMRTLPLPDGSMVQLNTDSAIAVHFNAAERHVKLLRGEAHFQVAKNPARPFIVNAGAVNVRAVGTAFDVRRRPEAIEVLVTEGKVQVDDSLAGNSLLPPAAESHAYLFAGQGVSIPTGLAVTPVKVRAIAPSEISQALAWQSHRLEFVAAPLAEMVEEFNRYNRRKLVIADPRLAARRFGGTFPAGDYEEFVHLLESDFGVVAERDQNEIRLRLAQ